MKVLITGGAGFIGSHLAERLLADGHEVAVIDNFETGRRENLPEHESFTLFEGSIANRAELDEAFSFAPDAVAHAAASYKDPDAWSADAGTNSLGGANVVEASREAGVGRILYFQTALCYGTQPIEQPITLDHPIRPDSSYAISKTTAEQYIELSGIPWVSLRLANIYGPRNLSGPPPTFYQRLSEGKPCFVMDSRRDFIFVDDLIDVAYPALMGTGRARIMPRPARTTRSRRCSTRSPTRWGSSSTKRSRFGRVRPTTPLPSCSTPRAPSRTSAGGRACR